jgi:transposase InsO family protein
MVEKAAVVGGTVFRHPVEMLAEASVEALDHAVGLRPAANGIEQKRRLTEFFSWYNRRRPHQALGWRTPDEAYFGQLGPAAAQAA